MSERRVLTCRFSPWILLCFGLIPPIEPPISLTFINFLANAETLRSVRFKILMMHDVTYWSECAAARVGCLAQCWGLSNCALQYMLRVSVHVFTCYGSCMNEMLQHEETAYWHPVYVYLGVSHECYDKEQSRPLTAA